MEGATDTRVRLSQALGGRDNALNLIRLTLAIVVIVAHSFPLSGHGIAPAFGGLDPGGWAVAGFFTISGYLIARSRSRLPLGRFLGRRVRRIFPAFWVALVATAFVAAPLGAALTGGMWRAADAGHYLLANFALAQNQWGIGNTLATNPYPDAWNGSLWTLELEFFAYLMAAALVPVIVRSRLPLVGALVLHGMFVVWTFQSPFVFAAWLGSFFTAGMVIWAVSDLVRPSWLLSGGAGAAWVLVCALGYGRELGPLPLALAVLTVGALVTVPWCRVNDLSYGTYVLAFPAQQLLAAAGAGGLGVLAFAAISTVAVVPLAGLSWVLVERPALRVGSRRSALRSAEVTERRAVLVGEVKSRG